MPKLANCALTENSIVLSVPGIDPASPQNDSITPTSALAGGAGGRLTAIPEETQ